MPLTHLPFLLTALAVALHLAAPESRGEEEQGAKVEMVGKEEGQVRENSIGRAMTFRRHTSIGGAQCNSAKSSRTGNGRRITCLTIGSMLPTEAQWESACRA